MQSLSLYHIEQTSIPDYILLAL
uniref:Uncharacterized protein n=1 Tax=Arundo donax TaxID=35708 RepID=A0A0A9B9P8_ARUDO